MRRPKAASAVSLFPFLAVLLCAMGALILLLIIMTQQIRETTEQMEADDSAAAEAPAPPPEIPTVVVTVEPPTTPPPPDPNIELRRRLAAVASERDEAQREVERLRLALAQRADAARSAKSERETAAVDLAALRQRLAAREAALRDREAERQKLLDQIREARGTLARVRQAAESAEPKVSIVPYDGRYGTARRPILIECTGSSIRFVPEDVRLTSDDVEDFLPDYNPLLAGTLALREHWQRIDGPNAPKPYVLLLVHEDGVVAYYVARTLLASIGKEVGYELVTKDLKLSTPKLDPSAQDACKAAVLDMLRQRSQVVAEVARRRRAGRADEEPSLPSGRFGVRPHGEAGSFGDEPPGPGGNFSLAPGRSIPRREQEFAGGSPVPSPLPNRPNGRDGFGEGENGFGPPGFPTGDGRQRAAGEPPNLFGPADEARPLPSILEPGSGLFPDSALASAGQPGGSAAHSASPSGAFASNIAGRPGASVGTFGRGGTGERGDAAGHELRDPGTGGEGFSSSGGSPPNSGGFSAGGIGPAGAGSAAEGGFAGAGGFGSSAVGGNGSTTGAAASSDRLLDEALAEQLPDFNGSRGRKRWGAFAPTANISLERPMPIEVTADAITVGRQEPISLAAGVTHDTLRAVAAAVQRETAAWGRAPGQFYWSPKLRATVRPGGAHNFDRLKRPLAGLGLPSNDRIALAPTAPAFLELDYGKAAR